MDDAEEKHPVKDSALENITPEFLKHGKDDESKSQAASELEEGEKSAAGGGLYKPGEGLAGAKMAEEAGSKLLMGKKGGMLGGKMKLMKLGKASAALVLVAGLAVAAIMVVGAPLFLIGNLDYNLMEAGGFTGTVSILEEQSEHVTAEMAKEGEIPENYGNDLAAAGLNVGQVTLAGDFVRTNKYIDNIEDLNEVAVIGSGLETHKTGDGELAFLFEGEVITADDFVVAVESNPRLYAALSEGANISAKYYYGDDVNKVYKALGLKRYAFHNWVDTGDDEQDQATYQEILKTVLDGDGKSALEGMYDCDDGCSGTNLTGDAKDILGDFENKDESAAQLLNSAISAAESDKSMRAFLAIEEPIQQTRINGDGAANEVMTTLYDDSIEVTYVDVTTGKEVTRGESIIETPNFAAAVSGGELSRGEAANFSRDRTLFVTEAGSSLINETELATDGSKQTKIGVGASYSSVDLDKAESSIQIALSDSNSNLYTTVVGGNRIPQGGATLNGYINTRAIGAASSSEEMVLAYNRDVSEALARKKAAERATKSPFDISSPNTFMGSILHGMASAMIRNRATSFSAASTISAVGDLASNSTNSLFGGAMADGPGTNYLTTFGDNCETAGSVGSASDVYCTQVTTIATGYMDRTQDDWGDIGDSDGYEEFVKNSMDRWAPVGIEDAKICEKNGGVLNELFSGFFGACFGVDDEIATGEEYVMGSDSKTIKKYSGFTLYDKVRSLLEEKESASTRILNEYYAEHPMDESRAGTIARLSGMTKEQVEIAYAYADYLTELARYDASSRYAFGAPLFDIPEKDTLVEHSEKINNDLYCFWRGRVDYGATRDRNFA